MKQNKLLILSLLASFLLLTMASYAIAENAVTFGTVDVCPQPAGNTVDVPVLIGNDVNVAAFDIVGQIVPGAVDLVVTGVTFDNRMGLPETLDLRYPIGDLGGGYFRFGAVKLTGADLMVGSGQVATLTMEFVSDCELGSATLDPATVNEGGFDVSTVLVDADANLIQPTVYSGAVNVINTDPVITNCPTDPFVIYWGDNIAYNFAADDPDLACGCDALTFSKVSGVGTITAAGVYTYTAPGSDVGCQEVVVKVADSFGGEATCTFNIEVLNEPPEFTECPSETINILWGQEAVASVAAVDPDSGPSGLTFTLLSFSGPGTPTVDPSTGAFSWQTLEDNAYLGDFQACIKVSDGANLDECNELNADTCCFDIHVEPKFRVTIDKIHDQLLGHFVSVPIELDGSYTSMEMGGFDFLIAYDASILTFVDADPGALLQTCGWEYFTYRYGADGNCGGGCPSGLIRIVALAETSGPGHPTCFDTDSGTELAVLNFYLQNDHTFDCLYLPIYWYWLDCGDNTISSKYGDTLFINDRVFQYLGDNGVDTWVDITQEGDFGFPSVGGAPDVCLEGDKKYPLRAIDFKNGGIDVICDSLIDASGDINVNGLAYEIADAVMFTNYFISGLAAFGDHVEASVAASDANQDGTVLSVADLVYVIRVIQGDALPYPKPTPDAEAVFAMQGEKLTYNSDVEMGAVLFVFNGQNVGTPVLNASGMDMKYGVVDGQLRVLVYNIGNNAIPAGKGSILTIPGGAELLEVEAAEYNGAIMDASFNNLPTQYELAQNYPNPFNPSTTIKLSLPEQADYSLAIYNVAGQLIRTYSGHASAGEVTVVWDGKDASGSQVASGIYFYKANASSFKATKKMILMK